MSDELKPCPFCGSEATWKRTRRGWAVHCAQRFGACFMNARTHYQNDKNSAIRAWNTRADISASRITALEAQRNELLEALEDVLDGLGFLSGGNHELEGWGISEDRGAEIRAAITKAKESK